MRSETCGFDYCLRLLVLVWNRDLRGIVSQHSPRFHLGRVEFMSVSFMIWQVTFTPSSFQRPAEAGLAGLSRRPNPPGLHQKEKPAIPCRFVQVRQINMPCHQTEILEVGKDEFIVVRQQHSDGDGAVGNPTSRSSRGHVRNPFKQTSQHGAIGLDRTG